jgi:S1-C subfamily serine protease
LSVEELTPQLAAYFGAKEGVLVASIAEDSPASRAGLKAGDVITAVNKEPVRSRDDLLRLLRDVKDGGDAAIGIVRDKKESTVTAKIESRRPARRGRPA